MKYKNLLKQLYWLTILCSIMLTIGSCSVKHYKKTTVNTSYIAISQNIDNNAEIENYLKDYREHISNDLSKILAYNAQDLNKAAAPWQNPMTNFYADAILDIAAPIFEKRTGKKIDFCLLNYGGIRATIAKGNITTRTAYDIMPFENNAIVLGLKGETVLELANFIAANKVAHPLSGIEIFTDNNQQVKNVIINGDSIQKDKFYYVITNDYLAKGGDKMEFFLKATESYSLDYKLRNMFIAYFTKIDTLIPSAKPRIIFE